MTAATTILVSLLGAVSLTGRPALRLGCDLAGLALLAVYLSSPVLFGHPGISRQSGPREVPAARADPGLSREPELQREPG